MATKNPPLVSRLDPKFGRWLRATRSGIPMNINQFAAASKLSPTTISDFELGHRLEGAFTVEVFARIAKGLNMELGYVLHMAGFDVGRDGINLTRLRRVEVAVETFLFQEHELRRMLAEIFAELDAQGAGDEQHARHALRGLAALDKVTERLRHEGFVGTRQQERDDVPNRAWSDAEKAFLRDHPDLSHEEAARQLGRSAEAVRYQRRYLPNGEES